MPEGTNVPCSVCGKPRHWLRPWEASEMCLRCARTAKMKPLAERFWARVDKSGPVPTHKPDLGPCWLSLYGVGSHGYPQISVSGRGTQTTTHVAALFLANGRWPEAGMHLCDNKRCIKAWVDELGPAHVIEGTIIENNRDMFAKGRNRNGKELQTHCRAGHPLSGDNLSVVTRPDGHTYRRCRECRKVAPRRPA